MVWLGKGKGVALFLVIVLPVLTIAIFSYARAQRDLTEYTFSRRYTIAQIAAIALGEKLDRLTDLGTLLATRVQFQKLISQGKWQRAIKIMENVHKDFPIIDRIFVTDTGGTLRADTPVILEVRGKNFSFRDWYIGVSRSQRTYVSKAYRRTAKPYYDVLAVAAPIESGDGKQFVGILVLQVRIDRMFKWITAIKVGPAGYIYFVDKAGNRVGHPDSSSQSDVVNYASVPVVQKVLEGKRGVEVGFDPIEKDERISAYAPVADYGWGVIVQQPTATAFAAQAANLRFLLFTYSVILIITSAAGYLMPRLLSRLFQEQAARIEAEKGTRQRDDFISITSHELKTPLTALKMQLQLVPRLLKDVVFPEKENFFTLFKSSLRQLDQFSRLADELLDVSRIDAGRLVLELQKVVLSDLILQTIKRYQLELTEAGCAVITKLDNTIIGSWDPTRIEQIVVNLLTNAMKYGMGKPIEITTQTKGNKASLLIRDYGIGLAKEDQEKIFMRFERAVPVTRYRGLGLGLYIARQIAQAHGGTIRVESELGRGSTFILEIPLNTE